MTIFRIFLCRNDLLEVYFYWKPWMVTFIVGWDNTWSAFCTKCSRKLYEIQYI